jgi:hypothetical protein
MTGAKRLAVLGATVFAAAVAATSGSAGSVTISTIPSWNGATGLGPFGKPLFGNFGETVTVPSNMSTLTGFGFELVLSSLMTFRGEVYAWDGTKATGPNLWQSGPTTASGFAYQLVSFNANAKVTPGEQLVLFLSVTPDYGANPALSGNLGAITLDAYVGGEPVILDDGGLTSAWTSTSWLNVPADDLAFTASFAASEAIASPRGGYCAVIGNTWADGTSIAPGTFLNLERGQASTDPEYKGATPAAYFQGIGITCDSPPAGYTDTGTKVNGGGATASDAIYEYWAKS